MIWHTEEREKGRADRRGLAGVYAMSVKRVKQIREQGTRAEEVETSKGIIEELKQYSEQILKFEAEF